MTRHPETVHIVPGAGNDPANVAPGLPRDAVCDRELAALLESHLKRGSPSSSDFQGRRGLGKYVAVESAESQPPMSRFMGISCNPKTCIAHKTEMRPGRSCHCQRRARVALRSAQAIMPWPELETDRDASTGLRARHPKFVRQAHDRFGS